MDPESMTDSVYDTLQSTLHIGWLSIALTAIIVLVVTAVISHVATRFMRKVLTRDDSLLPSSSIFINIVRIAIWCIGISVILSSCFNVDVSAAVTALGIGGIAISLGFQDTLSNLIGGLQVSLARIVEPGDNIEIGGHSGIVQDVTWRHTVIENVLGEQIVVPNSVIGTSALKKLRPQNVVAIPVVVTSPGVHIDEIARQMEAAADAAVGQLVALDTPSKALFSEVTDYGYKGTLTFAIDSEADVKPAAAKDAALRALAPFAHADDDDASEKVPTKAVAKTNVGD